MRRRGILIGVHSRNHRRMPMPYRATLPVRLKRGAVQAVLEPLMPKSRMSARADDRKIMNAIFYVLRTGMPWRDLPERYGPYTTAYNRFNRWSRRGIWKRIFDTLAATGRDSLYLIDSTIVKAHRAASGAKGGSKTRRSVSAAVVAPRKSMPSSIARVGR